MNILITVNDCASPALASILTAIKRILEILQIVGPILLILMLAIGFTKGVFNPEDKKFKKRIINSLLAIFFLFLMPMFVNAIMGVLGENFTVSECWNSIDNSNSGEEPSYREPDNTKDKKKTPMIEDKKYEGSDDEENNTNENKDTTNSNEDNNNNTNNNTSDPRL